MFVGLVSEIFLATDSSNVTLVGPIIRNRIVLALLNLLAAYLEE